MRAILQMEGRRRGGWIRVAVLCLLFGLWSFIYLAGAEMTETFCDLGELMIGEMATPELADSVRVAMLVNDVLAMTLTSDSGAVTALDAMAVEAHVVDAVAPLPGILVAGAGQPNPPANPPGPPTCPNPPPEGCPCEKPPCVCPNPPCGPPGSPSK